MLVPSEAVGRRMGAITLVVQRKESMRAPRMLRTGNTEHRLSSQHQEGRHTQEPDSTTLAVEEVQVSTACARNLSQHQVGRHTQEPDSTTLAVEEVQVSTALPLLAVMERLHW